MTNYLSDEVIVEFRQGNPHAYKSVFDCFRMRIFYYVKNFIKDQLAAEEITSDTFVKLYRSNGNFNTFENIQAFLFVTARNASLTYLRTLQRRRKHITNLQLQEEHVETAEIPLYATTDIEAEVLQFIYNEIDNLPQRSRLIFKYFYLDGLNVHEIAKRMNISVQTVANQKTTALKTLRMKVLDRSVIILCLLTLNGDS